MRINLGTLREYVSSALQESILVEGRVDDARDKFPDIEEETFDSIAANQPAGSNNKYLMWCCKQVDEGTMPEEVIMAIRLFHNSMQRLKQKDINQYKDVDELNTALDELGKNKSKSQEAKQAKADIHAVYNDDKWLVIRPYTTEASQKYGAGSKWCISATESYNHYTQYSSNNTKFYFVIDKTATNNAPNSKFAIAIIAAGLAAAGREIQVYNASDKLVPLATVEKTVGAQWDDIWKKIQEHVAANPKTREVEDAEKGVEEHVKALLKGEKMTPIAINQIAKSGPMTAQVVKELLKQLSPHNTDIMSALAGRAADMESDAAVLVMKWMASARPKDGRSYWSGDYWLNNMIESARLSADNFRDLAVTDTDVVLAHIYANPNAPDDLKDSIAKRVTEFKNQESVRKVAWEMIKNGKMTDELMKVAMTKKNSDDLRSMCWQIFSHPEEVRLTPSQIRMIPIETAEDFKKLLMIPNVPPDYVAQILTTLIARKAISKNSLYHILKSAPLGTEHVEQLWRDNPSADVRTALLQNPAIGPGNTATFAKSKNSAYRFAIAHNSVTAPEDLNSLASDESVSTRAAVGANPKTPTDTLLKLAKDEAVAVRASVASNAAAPTNVLKALKRGDSDDFVRKSASKTLKGLETTEALIRSMMGMQSMLSEALSDSEGDEASEINTPVWSQLPDTVAVDEFVAVFLLQHNGAATREEIEQAFESWKTDRTTYHRDRNGRLVVDRDRTVWQQINDREKYADNKSRTTTSSGKGWWWSPPGINKGALFRLTPAGASAAMATLQQVRSKYPREWSANTPSEPRKSPPPRELTGEPAPAREPRDPGTPRAPKVSYKIYGRKAGKPAHTRLKGQAYGAPNNTQFTPGEMATLQATDDGKLKVKKVDGDHEQTWDPVED